MSTYYAVCDVNGPISVLIEAEDEAAAVAAFEAMDHQRLIDGASADAEDELDIAGDGMDEDEFATALEAAGCLLVRDLAEVVNGHSLRAYHEAGGWRLWRGPASPQPLWGMPEY